MRYIERDGHVDKMTVVAGSKGEARQIAERRGCDDVLKVSRIGWPVAPVVVIIAIISLLALLASS